MSFNFDNNLPIYVQLVDQMKMKIISGELGCGQRLPSVRDLALTFKVNPNTVQKALCELEETGLIHTERTNGKFVTSDQSLIDRLKNEYFCMLANTYFSAMEKIGIDKDEAIKHLEYMKGKL